MGDSTIDSLHKGLNIVKILRCHMTNFFQQLGTGFRLEGSELESQEEREKAIRNIIISEMQKLKDTFT